MMSLGSLSQTQQAKTTQINPFGGSSVSPSLTNNKDNKQKPTTMLPPGQEPAKLHDDGVGLNAGVLAGRTLGIC